MTRRSSDEYYKYANEILKRPIDLIFIGEELDVIKVWNIRKKLGLGDRTFCLNIPFSSLPNQEHLDKLKKLVEEKGVYGIKKDARLTAQYLFLTWCKPFFLKKASELNPFETTHFCWIDFGYFHMREEWEYLQPDKVSDDCFLRINDSWKLQGKHPDRFRICILKDFNEDAILDSRNYYEKDNFQMAATVMGGSALSIQRLNEKFYKQINLCMKIEIPTAEENIIGRISFFFPELFDFTHGFYSTSLQNFANITKFPNEVAQLGIKWRQAEKKQESFDILSKIAEGIMANLSDLDSMKNDEIYDIFNELIICAFYVDYPAYKRYAEYFCNWLNNNKICISSHLEMNLSF